MARNVDNFGLIAVLPVFRAVAVAWATAKYPSRKVELRIASDAASSAAYIAASGLPGARTSRGGFIKPADARVAVDAAYCAAFSADTPFNHSAFQAALNTDMALEAADELGATSFVTYVKSARNGQQRAALSSALTDMRFWPIGMPSR